MTQEAPAAQPVSGSNATITIDECGFTGEDLANEDQPVMVVASHCISEAEAGAIKAEHFSTVKMSELKHADLKRRGSHQDMVVACLPAILDGNRASVAIAYKPFCVVLKMVDWLIEPAMHDAGLELYESGGHVAMAEVIFALLDARGDAVLRRAAQAFQRAVRTRKREDVLNCHYTLLRGEVADALAAMPNPFARPIAELGLDWVTTLPAYPMDVSLPLALRNCEAWRSRGWSRFAVVHDRSSAMSKHKPVWDAMLSPHVPPTLVGWGHQAVQYPIGVIGTTFVSSEASNAVQLADVVAGAVARWGKWLAGGKSPSDAYGVKLDRVIMPRLEAILCNYIWPVGDVEGWPVAPKAVANPLQHTMSILSNTG